MNGVPFRQRRASRLTLRPASLYGEFGMANWSGEVLVSGADSSITGNITGVRTGPSGPGTLLAQDAEQPELARGGLVEAMAAITEQFPLLRPKPYLPYAELHAMAAL